jgi:fimbrial chaperone protein
MSLRFASAAAVLAAAAPCFAYQLNPMSRVLTPSGSGATQSFEIVNEGAERIALEVSMASLERDESYVEKNASADDDFLVFPPQMIVPAGGRQTVRVTWLGDPNPTRERAYRIIVTQLPIEALDPAAKAAAKAVGQMQILLSYKGSVFIRPRGATPRLAVVDRAEPAKGADGSPALALTLDNSGSAGAVVAGCAIHLSAGGNTVELPGEALGPVRKSRVLAGTRRRYLLPWPKALPVGPVAASGRCDAEP